MLSYWQPCMWLLWLLFCGTHLYIRCSHRAFVYVQEDAYDAVKTHMFDLLAAIASVCQPSQLDMLFDKLERHQARDVQDTERLLALLDSLAEGDTEVSSLLWTCTRLHQWRD